MKLVSRCYTQAQYLQLLDDLGDAWSRSYWDTLAAVLFFVSARN